MPRLRISDRLTDVLVVANGFVGVTKIPFLVTIIPEVF